MEINDLRSENLEAPDGFEPSNTGFAEACLNPAITRIDAPRIRAKRQRDPNLIQNREREYRVELHTELRFSTTIHATSEHEAIQQAIADLRYHGELGSISAYAEAERGGAA